MGETKSSALMLYVNVVGREAEKQGNGVRAGILVIPH